MSTTRIHIELRSDDHRVLDKSTAKIVNAIPTTEVKDVQLRVLDSIVVEKTRLMGRRITLVDPTDKGVRVLETLDFPHNVNIFIAA